MNYPYFARLTADVNRASSLQIKLDPASGLKMEDAAKILNERLEEGGYRVASTFTIDTLRRFTGAFFDIIVYLLLAMGVLIASVGALGLAGTMSTNVLERTREIGVMRAIGASDGAVLRIVIVEGVLIGLISWMLGALLAFPVGALLAQTVGWCSSRARCPTSSRPVAWSRGWASSSCWRRLPVSCRHGMRRA